MSHFTTIEISDPKFETEHLRQITVQSPMLHGRGDISVFVPPQCKDQFGTPLLVLLHGVYGSHWAWTMKGGAHRTALRLIEEGRLRPIVIAMPSDGLWKDGSGYLKQEAADYERWIVEDVPQAIYEAASCVDVFSRLFLAGLSMGGYGALRLGAKFADRISGISAHSAITHPSQFADFSPEPVASYRGRFEGDADPLFWLRRNRHLLPPLRFDCGSSDPLLAANRALHGALLAEGVTHAFEEFEGGHAWPYWQQHFTRTLLFIEDVLRESSGRG